MCRQRSAGRRSARPGLRCRRSGRTCRAPPARSPGRTTSHATGCANGTDPAEWRDAPSRTRRRSPPRRPSSHGGALWRPPGCAASDLSRRNRASARAVTASCPVREDAQGRVVERASMCSPAALSLRAESGRFRALASWPTGVDCRRRGGNVAVANEETLSAVINFVIVCQGWAPQAAPSQGRDWRHVGPAGPHPRGSGTGERGQAKQPRGRVSSAVSDQTRRGRTRGGHRASPRAVVSVAAVGDPVMGTIASMSDTQKFYPGEQA